ncbi:unnamed protein product [Caenorhabditis bovis]|uniref:Trafficking protein particle complex subunit n=1 Tax=Caenorhabditis bovis TaxID=2654633 RepID=A0A8S1EB81_9PELO|nr:unnamed protein product [Caenorhabditis bovis]
MTIFNMYIFNREGKCLFYDEWFRSKLSDMKAEEEHKLVFGMMTAMKLFAEQLSGSDVNQSINFYKTSTYKMTFFESPTGVKLILNTDPNASGVRELLQKLYQAWSEVSNSARSLLKTEKEPDANFLKSKVRDIVMKHPCYV